jgi:hypothetical protein
MRYRYLDAGLRENRPFRGHDYRLKLGNQTIGAGNIVADTRSLANLHECIAEFRLNPDGTKMKKPFSGQFVYVVSASSASIVKIGKAVDPLSRLTSIQTGNHEKLFLHRAFYFATTGLASRVEYWAHEIAKERHGRLEGEWFSCSPTQAHDVVIDAANEERATYSAVTPITDREELNVLAA